MGLHFGHHASTGHSQFPVTLTMFRGAFATLAVLALAFAGASAADVAAASDMPPTGAVPLQLDESLAQASFFSGCPAGSYYWGFYTGNRQHYCVPCSHKGKGLSSKGCSTDCKGNLARFKGVRPGVAPTRNCAALGITSCQDDRAGASCVSATACGTGSFMDPTAKACKSAMS